MFTGMATNLFEHEVRDWRTFANDKTKENLYNAVRTSTITHLSQLVFYSVPIAVSAALIPSGKSTQKDIDDKWVHAMHETINGPMPAIFGPALTDVEHIAEGAVTGKKAKLFELSKVMPLETADNMIKVFKDTMEDAGAGKLGTTESNIKISLDYARGFNRVAAYPLPLENAIKMWKAHNETEKQREKDLQ